MNKTDQLLTHFSAYHEGTTWLGVVDAELPSIEALTETVKGAGIGGEVDMPVRGHYGSMSLKLNWRTITQEAIVLTEQKAHAIDLRGNQQVFDAANGIFVDQLVKVSVRAIPKVTEPGKFEIGATTGTANELEVIYIKKEIDGKRVLEIDKFNLIAFVNGTDALEQVRKNLGM